MKDLQLVEPFKHTYYVLDRITMVASQRYDDLHKLFKDHGSYVPHYADGYGEKILHFKNPDGDIRFVRPYETEINVRKAIICAETGAALTHQQIKEAAKGYVSYKGRGEGKSYKRENDLIRYKRNVRKIKTVWASRLRPSYFTYNGNFEDAYYSKCGIMGYHRLGHIESELAELDSIVKEYEAEYPNLVRGKRRSIPRGWSREKAVGAYDTANSWKHHSKRRKQWIPK